MIDSVNSGNASGLATALMNKKTTEENIAVEVVKKGQDIQKEKGEAELKLIDSSAPGRIDIRV